MRIILVVECTYKQGRRTGGDTLTSSPSLSTIPNVTCGVKFQSKVPPLPCFLRCQHFRFYNQNAKSKYKLKILKGEVVTPTCRYLMFNVFRLEYAFNLCEYKECLIKKLLIVHWKLRKNTVSKLFCFPYCML